MRLCLLVNALFGKYRLDSFVYFVQLDILDDELVCVFYTNIRYYYWKQLALFRSYQKKGAEQIQFYFTNILTTLHGYYVGCP